MCLFLFSFLLSSFLDLDTRTQHPVEPKPQLDVLILEPRGGILSSAASRGGLAHAKHDAKKKKTQRGILSAEWDCVRGISPPTKLPLQLQYPPTI